MRLSTAIVLLFASASVNAQSYTAIKDWIGGCDNTRHCVALGMSKEDADSYAVMHVERDGAADAGISKITLRVDHALSRELFWVVDADDARLLEFADHHLQEAAGGEGIDIVIEDAKEIATVMAALRKASTLTLIGDGGPVGTISLSGASAVMLWIDEQQQRLGTTTALVRRGDRQPSTIVAPPPPARISVQPPKATAINEKALQALSTSVRAGLDADSCEELNPDSPMADSAWQLSDGHTLVQLTCFSGAYNYGSRWFLVAADGKASALSFPSPSIEQPGKLVGEVDVINADFDPATGTVSSFSKGRGIGDCGSLGNWIFDGKGFVLTQFTLMNECRGVGSDLWPELWRSR